MLHYMSFGRNNDAGKSLSRRTGILNSRLPVYGGRRRGKIGRLEKIDVDFSWVTF